MKNKIKDIEIKSKNVNKLKKDLVDVCTIIEKCSIDEISKYLEKQGKKEAFQILRLDNNLNEKIKYSNSRAEILEVIYSNI